MAADRLQALLQYYEEDPDDAFTRFALALEYEKKGDVARAIELLEGLRHDDPSYIGTYYHLAALYRREGSLDEAERIYREGIVIADHAKDVHAAAELRSALLDLDEDKGDQAASEE